MSGKEQALKRPDDDVVGQQLPTVKEETKKPAKLIQGLEGGTLTLHPRMVRDAFGSDDDGFIKGLFNQVLQLSNNGAGAPDENQLHFIAGALSGIKPKDELEGMLAVQIIANHILAMKFAGHLYTAKSMEVKESLERMFTKLSRTTPAQMEALHRKRYGGKQKVTVEHVHVHEGGQAIVGNVETGGGGATRNRT
jgi:hypothetical protein